MKKLILCVDRDDDLGVKGGLNTPLLGEEEVRSAVFSLGLRDPEDSDTNCLLAGLKLYKEMREEGEDVEIGVIAGDASLGRKADEALATQLENLLSATGASSVILVSDGAEDESFYPVVASRVKVDSVKRVYVKQAPGIESIIHVFMKTMKEEKIQRKVLVPLGLALVVYGICAVSGVAYAGVGAIAITLGAYFFVQAYRLEGNVLAFYRNVRVGVETGHVSLPFSILSLILISGGVLLGWGAVLAMRESPLAILVITFFRVSLWWFVVAAVVYGLGKTIDVYLRKGVLMWNFFTVVVSLVAMGFLMSGALGLIDFIVNFTLEQPQSPEVLKDVFFNMVVGISLAMVGGYLHHYMSERSRSEDLGEAQAEKSFSEQEQSGAGVEKVDLVEAGADR